MSDLTPAVAGIGLSWNQGISTSTGIGEQESSSVVRNVNDSVTVAPRHAVNFEAIVYESSVKIPFTAKAVMDGALPPNSNGLEKASDLLTEQERTLDIAGTISVTGVTEAFVRTEDLGAAALGACQGNSQVEINDSKELYSPSAALVSKFVKSNSSQPTKQVRKKYFRTFMTAAPASLNDDTIGVPDGKHCEILSTTEAYMPTAACGFNDAGALIQGIFKVEQLMCRTYANGQLISQVPETQETFTGQCWNP
jgi:hypothetical protein